MTIEDKGVSDELMAMTTILACGLRHQLTGFVVCNEQHGQVECMRGITAALLEVVAQHFANSCTPFNAVKAAEAFGRELIPAVTEAIGEAVQ